MEESISLRNKHGLRLSGKVLFPDKRRRRYPLVIFSHGLNSGKSSPRNTMIANALLARGFAAMIFDYSGHGDSEGTISDDFISQQLDDLDTAISAAIRHPRVDPDRIGISGSSTGGTVAILKAAHDSRIRALVLRAPPSEGIYAQAEKIRVPTLIIQGSEDMRIRETRELYGHLACKKNMVVIDGAGHLFENPRHFEMVVHETVAWFSDASNL